jgi:hypothetical protein
MSDLEKSVHPDNLIGPNLADMYAANLPGLLGSCDAGRTLVALVVSLGLQDILGDLL